MRKKFYSLARKHSVQIASYTPIKCDNGAMSYDVYVTTSSGSRLFHGGYFIGDPNGKSDLLYRFETFIHFDKNQ